ncbi:hypothetical protein QTP86_005258 [Hemibagrus guttatus]|nr:hypothetical protein QTP86_005258 [Hemibagrus guttatus]
MHFCGHPRLLVKAYGDGFGDGHVINALADVAGKYLRTHYMSNLEVDGLQQQKTTSGFTPVSQEIESDHIMVTDSPKLERLEKDQQWGSIKWEFVCFWHFLLDCQQPSGYQWELFKLQLDNLTSQHILLCKVSTGLPSQWLQRDPQTGGSAVATLGLQLQNPSSAQGQQAVQRPVKKVTWRFPAAPQIPTPPAPVHFVRQSEPVLTQGVTAKCNETAVRVEVRRDLFGTEAPLNIAALTLGGCGASAVDASSQVFIYESALHGCNSKLTVTAKELVYIFTLGISSVSLMGTPIQRNAGAKVFIECHYPRLHNVSSSALLPAWIPYAAAQAAEELLVFSLRLMMDDWISERPSNQYYLGELINIEASVLQFNHVPLRVLIDSCVATAVPDINAVPRYSFIENYGQLWHLHLVMLSTRLAPSSTMDGLLHMVLTSYNSSNSSGKAFHKD